MATTIRALWSLGGRLQFDFHASHASQMARAFSGVVTLPPRHSTLLSLIARAQRAAATFSQVAAWMPLNPLATMPTPMPVPQKSSPFAPSTCTRRATSPALS